MDKLEQALWKLQQHVALKMQAEKDPRRLEHLKGKYAAYDNSIFLLDNIRKGWIT